MVEKSAQVWSGVSKCVCGGEALGLWGTEFSEARLQFTRVVQGVCPQNFHMLPLSNWLEVTIFLQAVLDYKYGLVRNMNGVMGVAAPVDQSKCVCPHTTRSVMNIS